MNQDTHNSTFETIQLRIIDIYIDNHGIQNNV